MAILEAPRATPAPLILGCIYWHKVFGSVPVLEGSASRPNAGRSPRSPVRTAPVLTTFSAAAEFEAIEEDPSQRRRSARLADRRRGYHMSQNPSTMTASVLRGVEDLVLQERLVPSVRRVDELVVRGAA